MAKKTKHKIKRASRSPSSWTKMQGSSGCGCPSGHWLHPTPNSALTAAFAIFGLIALVHAYRFVTGFEVQVDGFHIPVWFSGVIVLLAGWLAYSCWSARK